MTDTTDGAPAPKKRSLFKRAAWQDAPKTDEDIFSHSKDFQYIVAEQTRLDAEKRKKADDERKRKAPVHSDRKRRKVSIDGSEATVAPGSGAGGSAQAQAGRAGSRTRSNTPRSNPPLSPAPTQPPHGTLSARYDAFAKSPSSSRPAREAAVVIDLGDSDDDVSTNSASNPSRKQNMAVRTVKPIALDDGDEDEVEEQLNPTLAALAAAARARVAEKAKAAATPSGNGAPAKAPVVQLFIKPQIPGSKPLMVKLRTDHTLEKTRLAWCGKQGYTPAQTKDVFFTYKGERVFDSTTVRRLGIEVDQFGNVSIEGDYNLYDDDVNLPKVYVQAWTEEHFQKYKIEEAAASAAARKVAELPPPERTPTPEPVPEVKKWRLILKAKGKEDFKLFVNPVRSVQQALSPSANNKKDSTFGQIAHAYKQKRGIEESQPITLIFDGERLMPMDVIGDSDIQDMDSIDVLFK
ncbi:hypothetical protein ACEQ8H_000018 [Pleosporales sp. CAS-2024a]